ncbi:MAG: hypothetical protein IGS03_03500 [Candidatus Sericytochromatia bacterium]|nr:hypothetical protein [Candidatus Sericytochromatia bacterium]
MDQSFQNSLPTIEDASYLEPLHDLPGWLFADGQPRAQHTGQFACPFCGVGTSARLKLRQPGRQAAEKARQETQAGNFCFEHQPGTRYPALIQGGYLQVLTKEALFKPGQLCGGWLQNEHGKQHFKLRAFDLLLEPDGQTLAQRFMIHPRGLKYSLPTAENPQPTPGCRRFALALGESAGFHPLHLRPSVLDITGQRVPLFYEEALERFARLVLEHRPPRARTLVYASGQLDYFAVFAIQEVFRLLGVRNMNSNAEHGYLSGGLYTTLHGGEPAPFVSIDQALHSPNALYLLNGWNGAVSHPPIFEALLNRPDLDAWLVEVMMSESAQALSHRLDSERVLIIRSGGDSQLALAIARACLLQHPEALNNDFLTHFTDAESFARFRELALDPDFEAEAVAERIAPEFKYRKRIVNAIHAIAARLADPACVPVHIPSMGFSQTRGVIPHCLWANLLAMLGKFGLKPDGQLAGGVLQLPGQANHETHLQSLSPQHFMGRIPVDDAGAAEAALRLGLPEDAYAKNLQITPRLALDFSEPDPRKELFIFFGSQFASSMMNRTRWLRKLMARQTQFVVIDPTPDAFALKYAALILPTPPHVSCGKLFQNGEWRLSLSLPRRKAPSQARSDTTIVYDLMATISRLLRQHDGLRLQHADLAQLNRAGYLTRHFEAEGLPRQEGEVNRAVLWERIQHYFSGSSGNGRPLYCQPRHPDGRIITWEELLQAGSLIHGGVGSTRQRLDASQPQALPLQNLYGEPVRFRFFTPSSADLELPRGIVLCTGRGLLERLAPEPLRQEQSNNFNFSRLANTQDIPAAHPLFVSYMLAERYNLSEGDRVWITNNETRSTMVLSVMPTSRLKGETVYLSIYKHQAEISQQKAVNLLTSHRVRCPYTGQSGHKLTRVELQRIQD